jgi:TRAP-type C4-dicarboxylate transport system permease small subunit
VRKIPKWLYALDKNTEIVLMYFAGSVLLASVFLQIVTRFLMTPFSWTEEVARVSFVWFTFFGISYGIRNNSHVRFDFLINRLSVSLQVIFNIFYDLVTLAIWGLILYICVDLISFTHANRAPALNVTISVRNLSVVAGGILCAIRLLQLLIMDILKLKKGNNERRDTHNS